MHTNDTESHGRLMGFDKYSLILENDASQEYLIFKHAITVMLPVKE